MADNNYWDTIRAGSAFHRATVTKSTIQISATDSTLEALQSFQPIAEEVMVRAAEDGAAITEHVSSRYPGDLWDKIVVQFEE